MTDLQVRLLGPMEVLVDQRQIKLKPREQALLLLLVSERGQRVKVDSLVNDLWEEQPPKKPAEAIHTYVCRLRQSLGPASTFLKNGVDGGYVLNIPARNVDAWRFDAVVADADSKAELNGPAWAVSVLEEALTWWRGSPLDGAVSNYPRSFAWIDRIKNQRVSAIEMLSSALLLLGRPEAAVLLLEPAIAEEPWREGLVRRLMLALYRAGRQADAQSVYRECRKRFVEELGTDPEKPLDDLYAQILSHDPELDAPPAPRRKRPRLLPPRNAGLFGRGDLIREVSDRLVTESRVALHGLGGIGKSVVALEVAHAHHGYACWINAENEAVTFASLCAIAEDRGLMSTTSGAPRARVLHALWQDLEQEPSPLLVFDNASDPAALELFLPRIEHARVLVTSRAVGWGALGAEVPVGRFSADEASAYLMHRVRSADTVAAHQLAEELDRLPLACAQAAAFVEQADIGLSTYRELFSQEREKLLRWAAPDGYGHTVATTWQLSLKDLEVKAPAAARLLQVLAFLSPDGVPERLVYPLFPGSGHNYDLAEAVAGLRQYSLVDREEDRLLVHRLVQDVVRSELSPTDRTDRIAIATALLESSDPGDPDDPASWPTWAVVAQQAITVGRHAMELHTAPPLLSTLLRRTAAYLRHRGLFLAARTAGEAAVALADREQVGSETLADLHSELADLCDLADDARAARDAYMRSVELLDRTAGGDRMIRARARLGHLHDCAGDASAAIEVLAEAVPLLRESGNARAHIRACVDLGYALWHNHALPAAAASFQEALAGLIPLRVSMFDLYAEAVGGLGVVRQDQGHLNEAFVWIRRAVHRLLQLYPEEDHAAVAQAYDKYGYLLRLFGDLRASIHFHEKAHQILCETLGIADRRTAMALSNLGMARRDHDDLVGAARDQRQAYQLLLAVRGPEHWEAVMASERLAELGTQVSV